MRLVLREVHFRASHRIKPFLRVTALTSSHLSNNNLHENRPALSLSSQPRDCVRLPVFSNGNNRHPTATVYRRQTKHRASLAPFHQSPSLPLLTGPGQASGTSSLFKPLFYHQTFSGFPRSPTASRSPRFPWPFFLTLPPFPWSPATNDKMSGKPETAPPTLAAQISAPLSGVDEGLSLIVEQLDPNADTKISTNGRDKLASTVNSLCSSINTDSANTDECDKLTNGSSKHGDVENKQTDGQDSASSANGEDKLANIIADTFSLPAGSMSVDEVYANESAHIPVVENEDKMRVFLVQTAHGLSPSSGGFKANYCFLVQLAKCGHSCAQICYAFEQEVKRTVEQLRAKSIDPKLSQERIFVTDKFNKLHYFDITLFVNDDDILNIVLDRSIFCVIWPTKEFFSGITEYLEVG